MAATVADLSIRIKRIFGDESGTLIEDADILRWLNDAQLDIARKTHCLVKTQTYDSTTGDHTAALPAYFLFYQRATFDGRLLSVISYQDLDKRQPDRAVDYPQATPEYITFVGAGIELYPAPSEDGTDNFSVTYVARPIPLEDTAQVLEIPDQYYEALVFFGLMRAKELDQDWAGSKVFQEKYESELGVIRDDVAQPTQSSYPVVRDDVGDDW